jgi:hypothetical protein
VCEDLNLTSFAPKPPKRQLKIKTQASKQPSSTPHSTPQCMSSCLIAWLLVQQKKSSAAPQTGVVHVTHKHTANHTALAHSVPPPPAAQPLAVSTSRKNISYLGAAKLHPTYTACVSTSAELKIHTQKNHQCIQLDKHASGKPNCEATLGGV